MSSPARVCLVTFGSTGDVHPMLALGRALRAGGRPVTLLSNPLFAPMAAAEGLDFIPAGEEAHWHETARHPKLWHPVDGLGVMWRYLLRPALEPTFLRLEELARAGPLLVLAGPAAMGARLAHERLGVPLVSVYTAATMLRSVHHPLTLAHWRVPSWFPRAGVHAAWRLLDRYKLEPLVRPSLDVLRQRLGMPPLRGSVFGGWMHSPQAGLALFPDWFAAPAPDWPQQVRMAGFPLYDDAGECLSPALEAFLRVGPPPVVFMPGTARRGADAFFAAARASCERNGLRGVLLGEVDPALAQALPASMHAEPYAPFGLLLRRARALVHHGGVGSTAQALRAGLPQLVVPHAYDQFDNAMRLAMLGVGASLAATELADMPLLLQRLLADERVAAACAAWAPRTRADAAGAAVTALAERLA